MFVHSSRIQKQFDYLSSLGIDVSPLYKQTGIEKNEVFPADKTFDFEQYKDVLDFALRQTMNPEYGLDFGNQPQLGGTLGTMCACCQNLKEAFVQGCQFLQLMGDFARLEFHDDGSFPYLKYTTIDSWSLESPLTAKLEVDAMFSFLNTILKVNSNNSLGVKKLKLMAQKPENTDKYKEVFGVMPEFESDANIMLFSAESLMIPMKAFNKETFELLNTHLQSQLSTQSASELISDKVKRVLHSSFKYEFPDIESVASKLNLSARTLQRKLHEEQTTYKLLLQNTRFGIAKKLLKQKDLTISEISYTLGYSDLGNFSRSFKKYSGKSPQEYRES